jgi:hypothetical protein
MCPFGHSIAMPNSMDRTLTLLIAVPETLTLFAVGCALIITGALFRRVQLAAKLRDNARQDAKSARAVAQGGLETRTLPPTTLRTASDGTLVGSRQ